MKVEEESTALTSHQELKNQEILHHFLPDTAELVNVDVEKLKVLFELQEQAKQADFRRQMELLDKEVSTKIKEGEFTNKRRGFYQELIINGIQNGYKIVMSIGSLSVGTVLVLKGQQEIGYFLIGAAMSTVTTDVVGLMKAVKNK